MHHDTTQSSHRRRSQSSSHTCGKIPTPRGVMGMAHGATLRPVNPNWMAAMVSWKRLVLVEKNTGALIETALVSALAMTSLMSPWPSFCREVACKYTCPPTSESPWHARQLCTGSCALAQNLFGDDLPGVNEAQGGEKMLPACTHKRF